MDITKDIVKVCGIEVDGEFAQDIKQAITMKHLPYTVRIHKSRHRDALKWCLQQFGSRWNTIDNRTGTWCCFWAGRSNFEYYDFYFLNERDMVWVSLKWS
jgi:hypothetical protein